MKDDRLSKIQRRFVYSERTSNCSNYQTPRKRQRKRLSRLRQSSEGSRDNDPTCPETTHASQPGTRPKDRERTGSGTRERRISKKRSTTWSRPKTRRLISFSQSLSDKDQFEPSGKDDDNLIASPPADTCTPSCDDVVDDTIQASLMVETNQDGGSGISVTDTDTDSRIDTSTDAKTDASTNVVTDTSIDTKTDTSIDAQTDTSIDNKSSNGEQLNKVKSSRTRDIKKVRKYAYHTHHMLVCLSVTIATAA